MIAALFQVTHWRSAANGWPLCGAPANDGETTQNRDEVTCASCLIHLQRAARRNGHQR